MRGPLPARADVVIIGGGIIGVSTAYYLARKGAGDILLLERNMLGSGATGKCAGGIRTQFSTKINIQFSTLSRRVFEGFRDEFEVDPEYHAIGYLFLAVHKGHWDILKENAKLLRGMGQQVELLDPLEIQHRWPYLRVSDLRGGSYTPQDGFAGPYEVLRGFARGARRLGADLREGVEATAIQVKNGQIQAVVTSSGDRIVTPLVVNAAGPFAARIAAMVGLELPVRPLRRQIFFTDPFGAAPNLPMVIDLEFGWYVRREGSGLLLAGPQDSIDSFNETVDFEGMAWATTRSLYRMPVLEQAKIARGWAGLYEISPDHHAIIGRFPEIKSFICANGFSGHGFQHSPAAGILVAELIVDGRTRSLDITPLRPERFREKDLLQETLTAFRHG